MMLKHVAFVDDLLAEMSQKYFYCKGTLLIDADLPVDEILQIIRICLGGDASDN